MKTILSSETMDIPDGITIKVKARKIEVEGPRGKLTRNFKHLNLDFHLIKDEEIGKKKLKIDAWFGYRKTTAAIRTALSHVENLIIGVTKGYRYKMHFVYAHFPINASITGNNKSIQIRNFLGEKKVRKVDMLDGVTVVRSEKVKDELVLDGSYIELVSRFAALKNQSITFLWCNNVLLSGLKSLNSQIMNMAIDYSSHVRVEKIRIRAPSGSPNTDGIHVENSRDVTITDSIIQTGDDCISIGPGSMNMWIQKIGCGPGHGISIGSLANSLNEAGVQNITVANSVFTKTQNGVRLKSWARPSNGYAKTLMFSNLVMRNVGYPILIDQNYCPDNNCPHQSSGVKVSQVTYKNIKGTSSTQEAIKLDCSKTNPCSGITLQDIKLTFVDYRLKRPALIYCKNARGTHRGTVNPKSCF